ncbi:MAG: hypothetical protein DM484_20980 [Candidatus Methylumidiphilus alinenensis]|uniref:Uncharacterized protein n=1 Tax=Candidatus Methylumidiphilus alinenensis TaxID=2202197 RepID=A0A2W4SV29_9GAMM|nr:MAG: hypothetical protein DM484_20980 [Candidatus Methylumidiphilus alinenensis]
MAAILCFILFIGNSQFGSKPRHFGRDAEIQAKDGNKPTEYKPIIIKLFAIHGRWISASLPK